MSKRVAVVVFSYYPSDSRVRRAAEALTESGMSVDIICLGRKSRPRKESIDGVNVYRLPVKRRREGKLRYIFGYSSFIFLAFFILSFFHIRKHYKLVHIHNMPDFLIFVALLPRLSGAKLILDLHDPAPEIYMTKYSVGKSHPLIRVLIFVEKISIKFAHMVLTPNVSFRDLFISRGCPESKIHIVMNAPYEKIYSSSLRENRQDRINNQEYRLMYHGTIVKRHGLDIALEALSILRKKIPNIVFHVYGVGEFVESFLMLTKTLKLDDIVFYHGRVPYETIPKEIEAIDIGLIPNKKGPFTEINLPTRIFEYLCIEKPVVAPRTQGILDYFDDESLFFFRPESKESLADVIFNVYSHPERRRSVLAKGIETYKKYRWKVQRDYFLDQVNHLLEEND